MIYLCLYFSVGLVFAITEIAQSRIYIKATDTLNADEERQAIAFGLVLGSLLLAFLWPWVPIQTAIWPHSYYWVRIDLV